MRLRIRNGHPMWPSMVAAVLLASCSFGPPLKSALPVVRDIPVLAGLPPAQALERARTYLAARQYGLAIELFKAAGRDPGLELDSLNGLAIAYDGIGRGDIAERYFQKALALRTDDARTRRNLAAFYAASGQQEKHRALLADRGASGTALVPPVQSPSFAAIHGAIAKGPGAPLSADLSADSPLDDVFLPLLAEAALPSRGEMLNADPAGETTIFCSAGFGSAGLQPPEATTRIIRISIGEVFIATEADQMACAAVPAARVADGSKVKISNKDYLGLVAAYLEQLNQLHRFAGLALPARSDLS